MKDFFQNCAASMKVFGCVISNETGNWLTKSYTDIVGGFGKTIYDGPDFREAIFAARESEYEAAIWKNDYKKAALFVGTNTDRDIEDVFTNNSEGIVVSKNYLIVPRGGFEVWERTGNATSFNKRVGLFDSIEQVSVALAP